MLVLTACRQLMLRLTLRTEGPVVPVIPSADAVSVTLQTFHVHLASVIVCNVRRDALFICLANSKTYERTLAVLSREVKSR